MEYVAWLFIFWFISTILSRASAPAIMGLWFVMMCWEVYDMHADHIVAYSAVFLYAAYQAVHRTERVSVKIG